MGEPRDVGEQVSMRELKGFACLDSWWEEKDPEGICAHHRISGNLVELALQKNHFGDSFGKRMGGRLVRSYCPGNGASMKAGPKA